MDQQDSFCEYAKQQRELFAKSHVAIITELGLREEVMLPNADGIKLRTQFFFPQCSFPVPTIVVRSCYPTQEPMLQLKAEEYNKRGFAFIIQWCRGVNGSEGNWEPNIYDRSDGLSLMDHLQKDSRIESVGYWGDSYLAFTGWVMADAVPDKVKTMYLGVYGCDRYVSAYKDGLFRQDILTSWAMGNTGRQIDADYMESAAYRPQVQVDEAMWGGKLDWYRDWITNTDRDSAYWNSGFWKMLREIPEKIQIPLYVREGWYDHHLGSALATYRCLSQKSRAHSTLEIGPWNHGYQCVISHQSTNNLVDNSISSPIEWFDLILRKKELPSETVKEYIIGEDRWDMGNCYPLPTKGTLRFFLSSNGTLLSKSESQTTMSQFIYDPENPVESHGAESVLHTMSEAGSLVQPSPSYRQDIISFLSLPLDRDVAISGEINVKLYVSSDVDDTSFSAKLMEVFPDGTAVNIRGTITTLAYRNGAYRRGTYTPGEVVEINLKMWDIAWTAKSGSRLRLDISSSDFPQYAVHSNYSGIWSLQTETRIAHQTIYSGEKYPSQIELPLRQ